MSFILPTWDDGVDHHNYESQADALDEPRYCTHDRSGNSFCTYDRVQHRFAVLTFHITMVLLKSLWSERRHYRQTVVEVWSWSRSYEYIWTKLRRSEWCIAQSSCRGYLLALTVVGLSLIHSNRLKTEERWIVEELDGWRCDQPTSDRWAVLQYLK